MNDTIAITGIGAICSLGGDVATITKALLAGRTGLVASRRAELPYGDQAFGEVGASNDELAPGLDHHGPLPRSRTALLAMHAAWEATERRMGPSHLAVVSASTVGGMDLTEQGFIALSAGGPVDVAGLTEHPVGSHTNHVARMVGSQAMRTTISTACSSSANALIMGAQLLRTGLAKAVLAGGADALCRFTVEGFRSLGAMDRKPARPFSQDRAGMNLGEAAAYLVLERLNDVIDEGRKPIALLSGWCNRNDVYHPTATSPTGEGPYQAMRGALHLAGLHADEIDHINAHGTGTENNDSTELTAIERSFPTVPPFISTKAFTGHTLAAAGALEAVIAIVCMREGIVPAQPWTATPMEGHRSCTVPAALRRPIRHVLSNSFGFGGNDTALVLSSVT